MTGKNTDKAPTLRTIPMPADTNANGDIFGGWLLSQMDLAGAIAAVERTQNRVVTVGVDSMSFHEPVYVGDVVSFYTTITRIGNTSITIKIDSWAKRRLSDQHLKVTEGVYTYVAIDQDRKPVTIQK